MARGFSPELVEALLAAGEKVSAYDFGGYWLDIGNSGDYEAGTRAFAENPQRFLPGEYCE